MRIILLMRAFQSGLISSPVILEKASRDDNNSTPTSRRRARRLKCRQPHFPLDNRLLKKVSIFLDRKDNDITQAAKEKHVEKSLDLAEVDWSAPADRYRS
ncbi:MAG: hypothetical protein WA634_11960 [Silvibacterium sp.]